MNEETLFEQALSRPPGERAAFLEHACEGRPALLAAVNALLDAHEKTGNPLDRPPIDLDRTATAHPDCSPPTGEITDAGAVIVTAEFHPPAAEALIAGRYALVEKIGEGGMGEVWVARQSEPVKRRVAIKLIKPGMDSRAVLRRFEQERQALALMEHPNIARVIDGGMTADGRPFFVMELVNGLTLTAFCDEAKLGIRDRLVLFAAICQAVQHAHQKGIIHRDLKPSNILVTIIDGKPVPKVIDFGVAKATSGKLTDESLSTQFGAVVGTLEYMSPEQAGYSGEDIDTRADIYSLGVILYELLTGLRPIDAKRLKKAAFTEMIRIIKEEDPSKPSTRLSTDASAPSLAALRHTEPRKLAALLRGELDWVVMKCLDKHRERRYETANGLARDVRRYLDDEVVEARPPSAGYRVRKFASRHRGQVAAAGLLLLALLGGIVGTTYGLIREARANAELTESRAAVQRRYDLAIDAIETLHTGVSEDFLLKEDRFKELRNRLLTSASDFYAKLAAEQKDAKDFPSRRALSRASFEVAGLMDKVGRREDALAMHRRVLAAREALAAEAGADTGAKVDLADSLVTVGIALTDLSRTDEALTCLRKAIALVSAGDGSPLPDAAARSTFARAQSNTAKILMSINRRPEALLAIQRSRDVLKVLVDESPEDRSRLANLAQTYNNIGFLLLDSPRRAEALEACRTALAIQARLADAHPNDTRFLPELARYHNNIGNLLRVIGDPDGAMGSIRSGLAIRRRLAEANPAVTSFQVDLAGSHHDLGLMLVHTGRTGEALDSYRSALAIQRKLAEENPAVSGFQSSLVDTHIELARVLAETSKPDEAVEVYRTALAIQTKLVEANPTDTRFPSNLAVIHSDLGTFLSDAGRPDEALEAYRSALAIDEKLTKADPNDAHSETGVAMGHMNIGVLLREMGRPDEALASFRLAMPIMKRLADANPNVPKYQSDQAGLHFNLGNLLHDMGRMVDALGSQRMGLEIRKRLADANPGVPEFQFNMASSHINIGGGLGGLGKPEEALESYHSAMKILKDLADAHRTIPQYRDDLASCHTNAADIMRKLGRRPEAREEYQAAIDIREALARDNPMIPTFRSHLAYSTRRLGLARLADGDAPGAAADARKALALWEGLPSRQPYEWFEMGGAHATLTALAGREGSGVPEADRAGEAELAIESLKKAIGLGYRNPSVYRDESALDPLRDREDFRSLMAAIESKPPADPRGRVNLR